MNTIYRGSKIRIELFDLCSLSDDAAVAFVRSTLNAPSGPLAGEHQSVASVVLVNEDVEWRIASFHNTLILPDQQ
jgi:hypothetical protein